MTASTSSSIRWRARKPRRKSSCKLVSRSNEVLATRRTDASGHAQFEAGLASGEGGAAPAMLTAKDGQGDYAFLNLRGPAFDLTDRGVGGRPAPTGLDAFVYSERGVYRSGETAYLTALLRDTHGAAALGVPLTLVVERPGRRRIPPRVGRRPGLGRSRAFAGAAGVGAERHLARARLHRSETSAGRRDELPGRRLRAGPDRVRFTLAERPHLAKSSGQGRSRRALPLRRAGRRSRPRRRSDDRRRQGADRLCRLSVRPRRRADRTGRAAAGGSARHRRRRQSKLQRQSRQTAVQHASARSARHRAHGRARRPRRRAQCRAAGDGERHDDRRQAAILRPFAGRRRQRRLRRDRASRPTARRSRSAACVTSCCGSKRIISSTNTTAAGTTSRSRPPSASPTARSTRRSTRRRIFRCR